MGILDRIFNRKSGRQLKQDRLLANQIANPDRMRAPETINPVQRPHVDNGGYRPTMEDWNRRLKKKNFKDTRHHQNAATEIELQEIKNLNLLQKYGYDFLPEVRSDKLANLTRERFWDKHVMEAAKLVVDSMMYKRKDSGMTQHQKLNVWMGNLRKIGADSANGNAFLGSINSGNPLDSKGKNFMVIKTPQRSDKANLHELIHETYIGIKVGNSMRIMGIPNFSYVFGYFWGSRPVINKEKEVVEWARDSEHPLVYTVYESIPNSGSLRDACLNIELGDFLSYYLQILLALLISENLFSFTHNDLHYENVILRDYGEANYIRYQIPGGNTYYVWNNGKIPTIIDYGYSYMESNGKSMPNYALELESHGMLKNRSNFFFDAFKLLGFSMYEMSKVGQFTYRKLFPLIRYFFPNEVSENVIKGGRGALYSLPIEFTEGTGKTPEGYIQFIMKTYSKQFGNYILMNPEMEPQPMFPDTSKTDLTLRNALKETGIYNMKAEPRTFAEFYDVGSSLQNSYLMGDSESYHEFNEIAGNFNFYEALNIEKNIIYHIVESCILIKNKYKKLISFNDIGVNNFIKLKEKAKKFISQFYDMVKYIGLALRIRDELCFSCYAAKFFTGVEMRKPEGDEDDLDDVENIEKFNYNEPALEKRQKTKHSSLQDTPSSRPCICPIGQSDCLCDIETIEFLKQLVPYVKDIYTWSEYYMKFIKANILLMKRYPALKETVYMMENVAYA